MIDKTCGDQLGYETPDYDSSGGGSANRGLWPWMSSLGYHGVRICIDICVELLLNVYFMLN